MNKNTLGVQVDVSRAVRPIGTVFMSFEVKAVFFCCECGRSAAHSVVMYALASGECQRFGWSLLLSPAGSLAGFDIRRMVLEIPFY